jgi:hypothetical protein
LSVRSRKPIEPNNAPASNAATARAARVVAAEFTLPEARVQILDYRFTEPPDGTLQLADKVRLDLCLTARHRSAQGRFADRWPRQRFERIGGFFALPPGMALHARSDEPSTLTSVTCELQWEPLLELFNGSVNLLSPTLDRHLAACLDIRDVGSQSLMMRRGIRLPVLPRTQMGKRIAQWILRLSRGRESLIETTTRSS